jgi:endoglucanase
MQGETWLGQTELGDPATWLGTTWDANPQQRSELEAGFEAAAAYAREHDRPVFIGEFGTSNNADMSSRVRWTCFNRELAERHGFSWGCWSYGPAFALYDFDNDRWHSDLLHALVPAHE